MDGAAYRRSSPGRKSRFTQSELDYIRDVHRRWNDMRRERIRLCKTMGLCSDTFNKIGAGRLGKNARQG